MQDIELENVIIEITTQEEKKLKQLKVINSAAGNPLKKQVILYAPNYTPLAGKAVIKEGFLVARSKMELLELVKSLKK